MKRLYLDICFVPQEEDEIEYRFAFLTEAEAKNRIPSDGEHDVCWYQVSDVMDSDDPMALFAEFIQPNGLGQHPTAFSAIGRLHRCVHDLPVISHFMEEEQSLAKVLDIFIRVNSGGTVLSKSDLLLSVATAQFTERDAREAVHGLVDDLNGISHGFNFSKDMVLKTGMILAGLPDPAFKVENFTRENMRRIDEAWDEIATSLRLAARVAAGFGFSHRTLSGNSVLIPVAHYLHHRGHGESYLGSTKTQDRERIRGWMIRSLVKPGVWGSGLDQILKALTRVIDSTNGGFPVDELEAEMARRGKDLTFSPELIDDLVETPYRNKRVFPLLALLYPVVDVTGDFHEDHIFPKSRFTKTRLRQAGFQESEVGELADRANRLPNLQLLEGGTNQQKQAELPLDWVRKRFADERQQELWLAANDLQDLPEHLVDFDEFYEARRQRLRNRLIELLGAPARQRGALTAPPEHQNVAHPAILHTANEPRDFVVETPQQHDPGAPRPRAHKARSRKSFDKTLRDLLDAGDLRAGDTVVGRYRGQEFVAIITRDGQFEARGRTFPTPTAAAMGVTGQEAVNGWAFWHRQDGTKIGDLR